MPAETERPELPDPKHRVLSSYVLKRAAMTIPVGVVIATEGETEHETDYSTDEA